jgi:hypothetical protein
MTKGHVDRPALQALLHDQTALPVTDPKDQHRIREMLRHLGVPDTAVEVTIKLGAEPIVAWRTE